MTAHWEADPAGIYFSDYFEVPPDAIENYGALDISVTSDLPLFIDPFLAFNSSKKRHQALHEQIIDYLRFLRDKAATDGLSKGLIENLYAFKEVKQNWLGFTVDGNDGKGLGPEFAVALHGALGDILNNFGEETITSSSHLEKVALIQRGVGRDNISDFTTNLIKTTSSSSPSSSRQPTLAPSRSGRCKCRERRSTTTPNLGPPRPIRSPGSRLVKATTGNRCQPTT